MVRVCLSFALTIAVFGLGGEARASGCCYETKQWKIARASYDGYSNAVAIVPGNDTRVNLLLLIADRNRGAGLTLLSDAEQSKREAVYSGYYRPNESRLFKWWHFRGSLAPPSGVPAEPEGAGEEVCKSPAVVAFLAAVAAARGIDPAERTRLSAYRQRVEPNCIPQGSSPVVASEAGGFSKAARPFALYAEGAQAFYADDRAGSVMRFAELNDARDPWVREAASYMMARSLLRMASDSAVDDYGSVRPADPANAEHFDRAERAMRLYLRRFPDGRYATSMRGLFRRLYWLKGDRAALANEYQKLFALRDPAKRGVSDAELAEEIDNKLFGQYELQLKASETKDPVLLAAIDLYNMRSVFYAEAHPDEDRKRRRIGRAELEAQRPLFASEPALFDFLRASHAFYVDKKPAEVLALIPDAARQERFSYLEFSRQMLRGLALDATGDRNTPGFWRDMVAGATQPYQRAALEIAIAMSAQKRGDVASLFAAGTPLRDPFVRKMMLAYAAGPDVLRRQAADRQAPMEERQFALFTLLYKDLAQARHADFLSDVTMITPDMGRGDKADFSELERGSLRTGLPALEKFPKPYGLFACPPLPETVRRLAQRPRDATGQLCVSEFMRVNSLFDFLLDTPMPKDELGGGASEFPGEPYSRLEVYKAAIANPAASANDKAYALYRAIICYDNGSNDCGGVEVEQSQRAAWFRRLKRDYPDTRWAKMTDVYW